VVSVSADWTCRGGGTYSKLLQVVQDELSTGGLHDPSPVGGGVVGGSLSEGDTLSHLAKRKWVSGLPE
jgi:hypothetical protein